MNKPNCCQYNQKTDKCKSGQGSCPNKDMNNLNCRTHGVYSEGHDPEKKSKENLNYNYKKVIGGRCLDL